MKAIECVNISKQFQKNQALKDVSLTMEQGKIYALLGRNGAGKTTLLNCICTRYIPDTGEVLLLEEPAMENPKVLGDICFMTNFESNFEIYTVRKILKMARCFYPKWNEELMNRLLGHFEIKEKEIYAALSKGRQAALGFIIGMCSGCSIVLFDEIYSGMDAVARKEMYEFILEAQEDTARTFVMSTHLIEEMTGLFTDVILIHHGQVLLAEDMETVHEKSVKCIGRDGYDELLAGKNIVSKTSAGSIAEYFIYDSFTDAETEKLKASGMTISPMSLQELFIAFTGGEAGSTFTGEE